MRQTQTKPDNRIAITGMACRLPGAHSVEALWKLLLSSEDAIQEIPAERWDWRRFYDPNGADGKSVTKRGGFITNWDYKALDYRFFNLSAKEAEETDPQQRLLLECAVEALEDAGIAWRGVRAGVFIGGFALDMFAATQDSSENQRIGASTPTSGAATMLSARISHLLDLKGPSLTVDTACSSSLVAMHLGSQALLNDECDIALVGGVNFMLRPEMSIAMSQGGFLSADGRSKSFDARADGYGRGEGCGLVVLQKADRARERGDRIHALVCGTGINQDGHTQGIAQPDGEAQLALMADTLARTGLDPNTIRYIEAHGTGTAIGDATECQSISRAYCASNNRADPCVVGSIKSSIGHLEAGAGIAAVIKTVLVLKHENVPPQANLETLNPKIAFRTLGLQVAQGSPVALSATRQPLRAAINSFGYGGTNAHVILERSESDVGSKFECSKPAALLGSEICALPVSAQSDEALENLAEAYAERVEATNSDDLPSVLAAIGRRRTSHAKRAIVLGRSKTDLKEALDALSGKRSHDKLVSGRTVVDGSGDDGVAYAFSGMGPQWFGMARSLLTDDDVFRASAERCDAAFSAISNWSILEELRKDVASSRMSDTRIAQPANLLVQIGLVDWLASIGLQPSKVTGHSTGEIAAGYAVGMLTAESAMATAFWRSQLQARLSGSGTMLALGCGEEDASLLLARVNGPLSIAAINSDRAVTVAGDQLSLKELAGIANDNGLFNRFLQVDIPYHSHLMESLRDEVLSKMPTGGDRAPDLPLYSTVTGGRYDGEAFGPEYWYQNIRNPVRFADAIGTMIDDGARHFLEIGPHPTLAQYIREIGDHKGTPVAVTSTLSRDMADEKAVLSALGRLYVQGFELPWSTLAGSDGKAVDLPHYPWQRQEVWKARPKLENHTRGHIVHPLLGRKSLDHHDSFVSELNSVRMEWLPDHVIDGTIVFPAAGYIEVGAAVQSIRNDRKCFTLEDITFERGLTIAGGAEQLLETTVSEDGAKILVSSSDPAHPDATATRHATMRVSSGLPAAAPAIDVPQLLSDCSAVIQGSDAYDELATRGLNYGSAFRLIEEIAIGQVYSIATLKAPDLNEYVIHPCLLDACFQSVVAVFDTSDADGDAYVPVGIRTFRVCGDFSRIRHCLIRRVDGGDSDEPSFDLTLITHNGEIVASIHGFALGKVHTARATPHLSSAIELYDIKWEITPVDDCVLDAGRPWLVLSGNGDCWRRYTDALQQGGPDTFAVVAGDHAELKRQLAAGAWQGVLSFGALHGDDTDAGAGFVTELLRQLTTCAEYGVDLVVVTEKAQPVTSSTHEINAAQSAVVGALRVARNEYTQINIGSIDITDFNDLTSPGLMRSVLSILEEHPEVAILGDELLTPSIQRIAPNYLGLPEIRRFLGERPARLELSKSEGIDGLHWQDDVSEAIDDETTFIQIEAVALNLKDVLKALDRLPKLAIRNSFHQEGLGMEVMATVIKAPETGSPFSKGDKIVLAVRHGFRTHAALAGNSRPIWVPALQGVSPAVNASLPTTFTTALYALETLAHLGAGEVVLIHSAAGGVGQAAIQVAKHKGARIFATAGTEKKRQLLRQQGCEFVYDSRSLDFKEDILSATHGRGVDVVLNSIPGEVARTSLALLAHWGRFVEIGKADFVEDRPLASKIFNQSISYHAFDLDQMQKERPDIFQKHLDRVWERLNDGTYEPLKTTVFKADDCRKAFRYLARSNNVGKVAVELDPNTMIDCRPSEQIDLSCDPNAAFLVTGGLSGFGLETAKWLASRGAKNLVLASRQGRDSPAAAEVEAMFLVAGVQVLIAACDVAKIQKVKNLVSDIFAKGWTLKGVFHAAAVLDDGLIESQTPARVAKVMGAKAKGARNLHLATADAGLDHFVLFSSISSILGTNGQVAYAAANAYLDGLAHDRRKQGLPALSVNWGPIAEVGMAARDASVLKALERNGLLALNPNKALSQLDSLLRSDLPQAVVAIVNWDRFLHGVGADRKDQRFQHLASVDGASDSSPLLEELAAMPPEERIDLLSALIIEIVSEVIKVPADSIDPKTTLMDLGVDSLMATEIQLALEEIGFNLSTMEIGQGLPIERLASIALSKLDVDNEHLPENAPEAAQ